MDPNLLKKVLSLDATEKSKSSTDKPNWGLIERLERIMDAPIAPVFVRRNHGEWFPAFLVNRSPKGGSRLIVFDSGRWQLTRCKTSAEVVHAKKGQHIAHKKIVVEQSRLNSSMQSLVKRAR